MSSSAVKGPHNVYIYRVKVSAIYVSKSSACAHRAGLQQLGAILCISSVQFRSQSNVTVKYLVEVACVRLIRTKLFCRPC